MVRHLRRARDSRVHSLHALCASEPKKHGRSSPSDAAEPHDHNDPKDDNSARKYHDHATLDEIAGWRTLLNRSPCGVTGSASAGRLPAGDISSSFLLPVVLHASEPRVKVTIDGVLKTSMLLSVPLMQVILPGPMSEHPLVSRPVSELPR